MTHPDDNYFDTGLAAMCGVLGILSGLFLGGEFGFPMFGALGAIGVGLMTAGITIRDLQHRRHAKEDRDRYAENYRQLAVINEHLPKIGVEIVKRELRQLEKAGQEA